MATYSSRSVVAYSASDPETGAEFFAYQEEDNGKETKRVYRAGKKKRKANREERGKCKSTATQPGDWMVERDQGTGWEPFFGRSSISQCLSPMPEEPMLTGMLQNQTRLVAPPLQPFQNFFTDDFFKF